MLPSGALRVIFTLGRLTGSAGLILLQEAKNKKPAIESGAQVFKMGLFPFNLSMFICFNTLYIADLAFDFTDQWLCW